MKPKEAKVSTDLHGTITEKLLKYGIKESKITELLQKHDEHYLLANIEIVDEKARKGEIQNVPAYLLKAFESDYRPMETEYTKELKEREFKGQQIKLEEELATKEQAMQKEEYLQMRKVQKEQVLHEL